MPLGHWGLMVLAVMVAAALTIAAVLTVPGVSWAIIAVPLLLLALVLRHNGRGRK